MDRFGRRTLTLTLAGTTSAVRSGAQVTRPSDLTLLTWRERPGRTSSGPWGSWRKSSPGPCPRPMT